MKKRDFIFSKMFKLSRKITWNPRDNCNFLWFIISARGGHCDHSPRIPKNLAKPLVMSFITDFCMDASPWYQTNKF